MKYLVALLALTSVAFAQQPTTSAQIISQQIGNLVIQNAQLSEQIEHLTVEKQALQKQIDDLKDPKKDQPKTK
jgi:cell division protein FtsB